MLTKIKVPKYTLLQYFFVFLIFIVLSACNSDDSVSETADKETPFSEVTGVENSLPRFSVNTGSADILNEPKIPAKFTITDDDQIVQTGDIGIELRGSSSLFFPKKSYGLETWDSDGMDIDVSIFGMPEEEDWILYGPYSDKTLIRNVLMYDLAREMNHYASRTQFVELSINGGYNGVYVFMEKLKRDKERINVNKLKNDENLGEDLTGGYIIKVDKNDNGGFTNQNSFVSNYGASIDGTGNTIHFLYDYPKASEITAEQKTYISTYITDFEDALVSDTFTEAATGYANYIDIDSFVDFFILNEISNNVDGYRISTYMHKDKNEKLKMGPFWDFNLAFGNADYCSGGETNVWAYKFNERCPGDGLSVPFWWNRLLEDPAFVTRLKERWIELRAGTLADASILGKVDAYVTTLTDAGAVQSNFDTWPIFGVYVWPNNFIGNGYNDEIGYLKQWIAARTLWLDNEIASL